jgi:hypothetical protein
MDNQSLYIVNVPQKEYLELINDIVRMVTIQIIIQILFYINNPSSVQFLSVDFMLMTLYLILGICVYWLIIKRIVIFR